MVERIKLTQNNGTCTDDPNTPEAAGPKSNSFAEKLICEQRSILYKKHEKVAGELTNDLKRAREIGG